MTELGEGAPQSKPYREYTHPDKDRTYDDPDIEGRMKREEAWGVAIVEAYNHIDQGRDPNRVITLLAKRITTSEDEAATRGRQLEAATDELSTDEKTWLGNERALLNGLEQTKKGALLYLDLDRFKGINDKFGHDAGDDAIRVLGRIIDKALKGRNPDIEKPLYKGFRIHGDEFAVLTEEDLTPEAIKILSDEIIKEVAETPFKYNGEKISLSTSIGAVRISPKANVIQTLRSADQSLYFAKALGRGTSFVEGIDKPPVLEVAA